LNFKNFLNIFKKAQYIQSYQHGQPIWRTDKDEEYIKQAYNKIVWVYACVSIISSCVASVPWCLYRKRGNKLTEIEEHPILNIVNRSVNPNLSSKDFFDLWATYLALQGKFYAEYNNTALPTQIYPLYPHHVKPIPDLYKFIQGFEFQMGSDKKIYKPEEILWSRFIDPLNLYDGVSPVRALARTIDTENSTVDWNKSTLQNSAIPPGIIQVVNPSPELQEKLRSDWVKRYGGASNTRIPLVLNSEKANYVPLGLDHMDMDFLNQRKLNRIEICTAFGVPSQIVGNPEGQTYANFGEAQKSFWENTIIPRYLDNIKGCLNRDLVSRYADNLVLEYNLDNVQALHESIDDISNRVIDLFESNVITQNEARESLGYDKVNNGDMFNFELSKFMMASMQEEQEEETEQETEQEETQKKTLHLEYKNIETKREKYYKLLEKKVIELFRKELRELEKGFNNITKAEEMKKVVDRVINNNKLEWQKILTVFYVEIVKEFGTDTYNKLQKKKEIKLFDVWLDRIKKFIAKIVGERVIGITDTTKEKIKNTIDNGISEGLAISIISKNIKNMYENNFNKSRATTISQTETITASNYGSLQGAKESGANVKKIWIYTQDKRTRDSHKAMGSHPPVELDGYFNVNGSKMGFPCDSSMGASASEVVRCRCAIGYTD
jgi:HK97 family phage portal protein